MYGALAPVSRGDSGNLTLARRRRSGALGLGNPGDLSKPLPKPGIDQEEGQAFLWLPDALTGRGWGPGGSGAGPREEQEVLCSRAGGRLGAAGSDFLLCCLLWLGQPRLHDTQRQFSSEVSVCLTQRRRASQGLRGPVGAPRAGQAARVPEPWLRARWSGPSNVLAPRDGSGARRQQPSPAEPSHNLEAFSVPTICSLPGRADLGAAWRFVAGPRGSPSSGRAAPTQRPVPPYHWAEGDMEQVAVSSAWVAA